MFDEQIASDFVQMFPETRESLRTVGREAEYVVVNSHGFAVDIEPLLHKIFEQYNDYSIVRKDGVNIGIKTADHQFLKEVGKGTIEVVSRPCSDLWELRGVHQVAMRRLLSEASKIGYSILGIGLQPRTTPSWDFLTKKPHYRVLYTLIPEVWDWFELMAGDQLHISIQQNELLTVVNLANAASFIVAALCGNSSIYDSQIAPAVSYREYHLQQLLSDNNRHGPAPFAPTMEDLISNVSSRRHLFFSDAEHYRTDYGSFRNWTNSFNGYTEEIFHEYLFHSHYNWNSARLRPLTGTIEMRASCQLPPAIDGASSALYLGLVEGVDDLYPLLSKMFTHSKELYLDTCLRGMTDVDTSLIRQVLDVCSQSLSDRGREENLLLDPMYRILDAKENPGQKMRNIFQTEGLMEAINHCKWTEEDVDAYLER
ncbi:glutamate-cysteine ligase family protein [Bifidobacterium pullorum]|uniref:glutamate-cysteine ligase family protein n=1 Tax=Bifidobacterium pullorum TaxID=78448 RepID=UPI00242EC20C|nr:glutamate-cysteine ligase family protein [Bifidobacterium pullorum]